MVNGYDISKVPVSFEQK